MANDMIDRLANGLKNITVTPLPADTTGREPALSQDSYLTGREPQLGGSRRKVVGGFVTTSPELLARIHANCRCWLPISPRSVLNSDMPFGSIPIVTSPNTPNRGTVYFGDLSRFGDSAISVTAYNIWEADLSNAEITDSVRRDIIESIGSALDNLILYGTPTLPPPDEED
jgi:hypothetical protein